MLDGHLCFFFFEEVSIQMFFLVFFLFLGWVHLLLLSCKTLDFLGMTPVCVSYLLFLSP